jgi:hypothetical protein
MLDGGIPSPVHGLGYLPPVSSFEEVAPGHLVAQELAAA